MSFQVTYSQASTASKAVEKLFNRKGHKSLLKSLIPYKHAVDDAMASALAAVGEGETFDNETLIEIPFDKMPISVIEAGTDNGLKGVHLNPLYEFIDWDN